MSINPRQRCEEGGRGLDNREEEEEEEEENR